MKLRVSKCERIFGSINVSGSKNTALPIIAASLLSKKTVTLKNVPLITDVLILLDIIKSMGVEVKRDKNTVKIKAKSFNPIINSKDVCKIRGSYYLIGASLARYNICSIKMPGGCDFASRPIDLHLKAFECLGYKISFNKNTMYITKEKENQELILFEKKSLGATINAIIASSLLNQPITIENVSTEPEVLETINFLKKMGVDIVLENDIITIQKYQINKIISFSIVSDRIEAGSYMLLAASIPNSKLYLRKVPVQYMESVFEVLKLMGCDIVKNKEDVIITSTKLMNLNVEIKEYPCFPTDLQQILTATLLKSNGTSYVKDNIYPQRTSHVNELNKMNGKVKQIKDRLQIKNSNLKGTKVTAHDLRAAFSLIVAGCIADGETIIENAEVLLRGYEKPIIKLKKIGVSINEYIRKT